jgi:hypothetical protein
MSDGAHRRLGVSMGLRPDLFRFNDNEWNATVHVLAFLNEREPGGARNGKIASLIHPDQRRIDWDVLIDMRHVWSSGERLMFDVAAALWSGQATAGVYAGGEEDDAGWLRPLAPLADVWSGLSDAWFDCVMDAIRIRRGAG